MRVAREEDKHGLNQFHAMLATDSICHVKSKSQTKGYGPTVNHLKVYGHRS
jgi:hypothetical protein